MPEKPEKADTIKKTLILPPTTAVRIVWALTGSFSDDLHSQRAAEYAEQSLKSIESRAQKCNDEEKQYVSTTIAAIQATRRSLDTVYKGRKLNFEENKKLRSAYLDSIKEGIDFGNKAQDFLKSLPAMTIAGAGGLTLADYFHFSGIKLWGAVLGLAAIGYLINMMIKRYARRMSQMLYIKQDYERNMYYEQYVARVQLILESLYADIDQVHHNIFGTPYPDPDKERALQRIVTELLAGVQPTPCKYIHKHITEGKITPELWSKCETGTVEREAHKVKDRKQICKEWED
jgi:hypothetical protein